MTRITYGAYRAGVRDPRITISSMGARPQIPTPFQAASGSIMRYHREGPAAAWQRLDEGLRRSTYWGPGGTPQARGWADAIRQCFRNYERMAGPDPRRAFGEGLNRELSMPPNDLAVHIDVLLLDSAGYVPRLVLWDTNDLTPERAALYAAPAWAVVEDELGVGRIPEVEIWHLRTGTETIVPAGEAARRLPEVTNIVHRLSGSGP